MILNEDFFDEVSDIDLTEMPDDMDLSFQHNIIIESSTHDNYSYSYYKDALKHINVYFSSLNMLLTTSPIVESYKLFITDKTHSEKTPTDINELKKLSYNTFLSNQKIIRNKEKNKETIKDDEKVFNFPILLIEIRFFSKNAGTKHHIDNFYSFIHNLVRCAHNNSKSSFVTIITLDDIIVFESYKNGPGTITTQMYNSLFDISDDDYTEKNVHSFGNKPHYKYNGSVRLNKASRKTVKDFKPFQLIYSTKDNKIVSQAKIKGIKNIPIGVCIEVGVDENDNHYALFMGIRSCSCSFPDSGTRHSESCLMCCERDIFHKDRMLPEIRGSQGWKNTQILYDFVNKEIEETGLYDKHWKKGSLMNDKESLGIFPALSSVWRYRTFGTRSGDWFIPSESEVKFVVDNNTEIYNAFEKVSEHYGHYYTSIVDFHVWSSNVISDTQLGFKRMLIPVYFYSQYQLIDTGQYLTCWPVMKVIDYDAIEPK